MECKLQGTLMELKTTQKNNRMYLVMYSEGKLYNVFPNVEDKIEKYAQHLGKHISLTVKVHEPKFISIV